MHFVLPCIIVVFLSNFYCVHAQDYGFKLTGLHKNFVKEQLHDHDVFISSDDDILLNTWQIREFIELSYHLKSLQLSTKYLPGFYVFEIDLESDALDSVQWKNTEIDHVSVDSPCFPLRTKLSQNNL